MPTKNNLRRENVINIFCFSVVDCILPVITFTSYYHNVSYNKSAKKRGEKHLRENK